MARRVKTELETVRLETKLLTLQYSEPNTQTRSRIKMKEGMQFRVDIIRSAIVRFTWDGLRKSLLYVVF